MVNGLRNAIRLNRCRTDVGGSRSSSILDAGRNVIGPDKSGMYQVGFVGRATHIGAEIAKIEARALNIERRGWVRRIGNGQGRIVEDGEELVG